MAKVPKICAGYIGVYLVAPKGTSCDSCRDFIQATSECVLVDPPHVSGPRGTCTHYVYGRAQLGASPLRLVPKKDIGYIQGSDVPTYCGRCKHYADPSKARALCEGVGDSENDLVDNGGCCNFYEVRK